MWVNGTNLSQFFFQFASKFLGESFESPFIFVALRDKVYLTRDVAGGG